MLIYKAQIQEFTFPEDVDPKTVFNLGVVDHEIATRLIDANIEVKRASETEEARSIFHTNEQLYLFALCGIKGWSNFKDAEGKETPFQVEEKVLFNKKVFMVKANLLTSLPLNKILDLGAAVKNLCTLGVDETKN